MSIRPVPCAYACSPRMRSAVEVSAVRSLAGGRAMFFCLAAERSSAEAPAACGDAIDVPCNIW